MSKDLKAPKLGNLPEQLSQIAQRLNRYRVILFVVFVSSIYGFTCYKIFILSDPVVVTDGSVDTQVTNLTPRIDIAVVDQLQNLKDNSVNVKTLFKQNRNNPFAE